ncbi:MAG: hypothetical protein WA821_15285 [Anaerolineales bacterium]
MAEADSRKDFISRVGTFFVVVSLFLIIIFIASDISRNNAGRQANATQTFIAAAVQALQTRDTGAAQAAPQNLPTPTLALVISSNDSDNILTYTPAFCLGAFGLLVGWFFRRISASPSKPSNRWEGIRKMQQKQREGKDKKKEKEKKK